MFLEMFVCIFWNHGTFSRKNKKWPFREASQKLFLKFYDKKYTDDYKGIQYTPYSSYDDDENCDDYDKEIKTDEIDE